MPSLPATHPIIGTNDDDTLQGTRLSDVMSGRFGDDVMTGGNGYDEIWGGTGDDVLNGNSGNDILYGSGGPTLLDVQTVDVVDDHPITVIFEGETAGYRNTFGYYKVAEDGTITDVKFVWPNASLQNSGGSLIAGVSSATLDATTGDTVGFFIVSNGYSLNAGYQHLDLENGTLAFLDSDGNPATLQSQGPRLYHIAPDGITQTVINTHAYHTLANGDNVGLNPDGIPHTTGVLKADAGTLTIGMEDLYNGGDRDFDDSVFTIDMGLANALTLSTPQSASDGGTDGAGNGVQNVNRSDNDHLDGDQGSDELHGRSGNDVLIGDTGNDTLHGGSDNDELFGGSGEDALYGNSGDDILYGGNQNDELNGNSGSDQLFGGAGEDSLIGGAGEDSLFGGNHDDNLIGGSGNDQMDGGYGDDVLKGGGGDDRLDGGRNNDELYGGSGDDVFIGNAGNDFMHGGSGNDTVDYSMFTTDLDVMLHDKRAHGLEIGTDTMRYIDNVKTGSGDDYIKGTTGANVLEGGAGDDEIRGLKGADTIFGGEGADTFVFRTYDVDAVDRIADFDLAQDRLDFTHFGIEDTLEGATTRIQTSVDEDGLTVAVDIQGSGEFTSVCTLDDIEEQSARVLFESDCFLL